MSTLQWARNFTINADHVESLMTLLLEREMPLSTSELALALIEQQLEEETAALKERFKDARLYNPSQQYAVGQNVIFPAMDFAAATVTGVRPGNNPEYGDYQVIGVRFENEDKVREFAAALAAPHKLSQQAADSDILMPGSNDFSANDVLNEYGDEILAALEEQLVASKKLIHVGRKWFPRDLIMEVNEGHLHLAEAVLDMVGGGPLTTEAMLEQIGGLGDSPQELQVFSLNYALSQDTRFDEVGPAGEVLWYLTNVEPAEVRQIPPFLRYTHIDYNRDYLTQDMLRLEQELGDELSPLTDPGPIDQATVILIYPHRRSGTLPLTPATRRIFPTARRAPRIYVTLVDAQDGEEYTGWAVHRENYVFGLNEFYRKHKLPIGGYITVRPDKEPGKIVLDFPAHRPRTEYVRLIGVENNQIQIGSTKRPIGAEFDDLMIVGIDELEPVEEFAHLLAQQRRPLAGILKLIIPPLGRLTPQGTVHARTLYSVVNVFRRCPPGLLLSTLNANPDFENVGGHYWKLSDE